jgi:hypothetical protein
MGSAEIEISPPERVSSTNQLSIDQGQKPKKGEIQQGKLRGTK